MFQVVTSAGSRVLTVDTMNSSVAIGNTEAASDAKLLVHTADINLRLNKSSGTVDFLQLQNAGTNVMRVDSNGNLLAVGAATGTTRTTEAIARTNVTTVTLTSSGFANNDVIRINNGGQDYYTRITAGGGTTSLTVSPAVSYDASATVEKYNVQNIGATTSDYTTESNRYFQGYFLGGVVTGAGTTTLSDRNLTSTGNLTLTATAVGINQAPTSSGSTLQVAGGVQAVTASSPAWGSALAGTLTYDSTDGKFYVYDGSAKKEVCNKVDALCGGNSTTLQQAYDASTSPATIALTAADDNLVFQNPASGGTDIAGAAVLKIDQLATGNVEGLRVESAGTGNLLTVRDTTATAQDVFKIADGGATTLRNQTDSATAFQIQSAGGTSLLTADTTNNDLKVTANIVANGSATATTGTTTGTGTNTTTLTLTTDAFAVDDVVYIDNAGQDYYTRITVDPGTGSYTVSPAVTFETGRTVTKYNVQNIGSATNGSPASNNERFFQGYFLGGIVAGAGSTHYADGGILFQGDTNLYRLAANILQTDDTFISAAGILANYNTANTVAVGATAIGVLGPGLAFGSAADTNIYRSAANTLKTDDNFLIQTASNSANAFQVQNAASATVLNVDTSTTYNLVTNGDIEGGIMTGWTAKGAATLTQSTSHQWQGNNSLSVAASTGSDDGAKYTLTMTNAQQYTFSFYAKVASGSITDINIGYRNTSGGSDNDCLTGQTITTAWTRFSCNFTATSPDATGYLYVNKTGGSAETFFLDGIMLETGSFINVFDPGGRLQLSSIVDSPVAFRNKQDSAAAFQVQSTAGVVLSVDTANQTVGISTGGAVSDARLYVDTSANKTVLRINATGTSPIFEAQKSGTNVLSIGNTGNVISKNTVDSTSALQIQNAVGSSALTVDTTAINSIIDNSSIEGTGVSNWALKAGTGTVSRDTTQSYIGSASLKTLLTSTAIGDGVKYTTTNTLSAATYTLSFNIKQTAGTAFGTNLQVGYNNGSDNNCTLAPTLTAQPIPTTGWARYSCTFTTTGTTTYIYWKQADAPASARTFYIDALQLETGSTVTAYKETAIALNGVVNSRLMLQNISDSTTAFRIQNSASSNTLFTADTLNNRLVVGDATGTDTNTTLLVLDSGSTDPTTGTIPDGSLYYNTSSGFRCRLSGAWTACNATAANAFIQGGNSFATTATLGTNDNQALSFETSGTTRLTINSGTDADAPGGVGINSTAGSASGYTMLAVAGTNATTDHSGYLGSFSLTDSAASEVGQLYNYTLKVDSIKTGAAVRGGNSSNGGIFNNILVQGGSATWATAYSAGITPTGGTITNAVAYSAFGTNGGVAASGTVTNFTSFAASDYNYTLGGSQYGLYVYNLTSAATNYAIYTNAGKVHLGDTLEVAIPNVAGNGSTAANAGMTIQGGTGQTWNGNNGTVTSGAGSLISLTAGAGGSNATAAAANNTITGGAGGAISLTGAVGGAASSTALLIGQSPVITGGNGSAISITSGAGGNATKSNANGTSNAVTTNGGNGGDIIIQGAAGGSASGADINNAGRRGYITLQASGGNVGIGTNAPSTNLHVVGGVRFANLTNTNGILYTNSTGVISQTSTGGAGTLCLTSASGGTPTWSSCSGATVSLQGAYDASTSPATIALTAADDNILFQNPASGGTDIAGAPVLKIENLATGNVEGLRVESAGTGNLLTIRDTTATAQDVFKIADGGATTLRNQTDSTAAFQVQTASGGAILTADTTINQVNVVGNLNLSQITAPTAPTATAVAGSGLGIGAYAYAVTYVSAGGETNYGTPVNVTTTGGNQQVNLTNIPVSSSSLVTSRKIYRTVVGGGANGPFFLVTTLANNTTTTYSDNTADGSLGVRAPVDNRTAILKVNNASALTVGAGNNVWLGLTAGSVNTSGNNDTAVGHGALSVNTTGSFNTATGSLALNLNTIGDSNSAFGASALESNTGSSNTAVGTWAGYSNTTGSNNTFLGAFAGEQDPNRTTFDTLGNLQNATAIGYGAQVQQSNSIVLGSVGTVASNLTPNVGIGTTSPANLFSISPNVYDTGTASVTSGTAAVSGSGTTWTSNMVGNEIVFADGKRYTILSVGGAGSITLSTNATSTETNSTYRIHNPAFYVSSTGSTQIRTSTNSTTAFRIQSANADVLLAADTTNNVIKVGNSTASTSADTTLFQLDNTTTTNRPAASAGLNGSLVYNTTTGRFEVVEGGAWKTLCNSVDPDCATTLQQTYTNSSPATITTADAKDLSFILANTTTDSNFIVNIASSSTSKFGVQYNGTDTFSISNAASAQGSALFKNAADNANAFVVQNVAGNAVFGVDTSSGQAVLGKASTLAGKLVVHGATSGNVTLSVADTVTSYAIKLPGAAPTTGQCLKGGASTATNLEWGSCGGGGGGSTRKIYLVPEYPGGVISADGGFNSGTMTSDYDSTNRHNYYSWVNSTASLNDYDIIARSQIPSEYASGFGTFKIWAYGGSTSTANNNITVTVRDSAGTACATSVSVLPGTANTWTEQSVSLSGCTFAANDLVTISVHLESKSSNAVRIGEISYQYTN
jgi:hypothetical protein